ncbi:MAG: hypothetical protein DMF40_11795 [Verrucomicrobia bacterium]|nr:MAG: hypothetical protein DME38_05770 [Verrucomicrobiota bacterium]PYL46578.1 MAG: hypothetical protein DMF40_11795 [Verrucomicrobiota bacterium]
MNGGTRRGESQKFRDATPKGFASWQRASLQRTGGPARTYFALARAFFSAVVLARLFNRIADGLL